ncbi:spore germination protein [Bacillus sp. AFS041924]|uniref:spore germination protein n=1 Tax=Bacillus sp. AFS041924 TaxID=2033503 RepID=UPI000BFB50A0|nr:spore germination protein [Bacillus sp. AFS041924]PGS51669.1 spore germination protein [Bacillus sp. AFS041924]
MKTESFLDLNEKKIREILCHTSDFKTSDVRVGEQWYRLYYLNSMIDKTLVQDHIIRPLLQNHYTSIREAVTILDYQETEWLSEVSKALVAGKTVVQKNGETTCYLLDTEQTTDRTVSIPLNERVLRGSHKALNENLDTNLNMLRKLVETPDLIVKSYAIGRRSNSKVAVLYLHSLANEVVLMELEKKIASIDIDYVESPGFVEELITDDKFSLFPKFLISERTDRIRSYLMDGKIAILTDGSPECVILPVSFWSFFQTPDDYQVGWIVGSMFRFLRIACFIFAISLPGLYVALVTFDPRIIPFEIALTLKNSMQLVALPPILEALIMLVTLEVLRESAIRLPSPIGQTIGVVGGIVIGTVVVQTNLISNMMVVVTALTGVSSFIIPSYEMSNVARIITYPFLVMASMFGLVGLEISFFMLLTHLARIHTIGIPYFYAWFTKDAIKDTLFRAPIKRLKKRSIESVAKDLTRLHNPKG